MFQADAGAQIEKLDPDTYKDMETMKTEVLSLKTKQVGHPGIQARPESSGLVALGSPPLCEPFLNGKQPKKHFQKDEHAGTVVVAPSNDCCCIAFQRGERRLRRSLWD